MWSNNTVTGKERLTIDLPDFVQPHANVEGYPMKTPMIKYRGNRAMAFTTDIPSEFEDTIVFRDDEENTCQVPVTLVRQVLMAYTAMLVDRGD